LFRSASFWLSVFFILFYISYTGFQLGRNIWLSEWSDANENGKKDKVSLGVRLGLYATLGVVEGWFLVELKIVKRTEIKCS
jgi:hypothetical protein